MHSCIHSWISSTICIHIACQNLVTVYIQQIFIPRGFFVDYQYSFKKSWMYFTVAQESCLCLLIEKKKVNMVDSIALEGYFTWLYETGVIISSRLFINLNIFYAMTRVGGYAPLVKSRNNHCVLTCQWRGLPSPISVPPTLKVTSYDEITLPYSRTYSYT